jgi:hypothetical protein
MSVSEHIVANASQEELAENNSDVFSSSFDCIINRKLPLDYGAL